MIEIKIKNYIFTAKVVKDPESIALGMMGKTFDMSFNAMLFLLDYKLEPRPYSKDSFEETNDEYHCFWMKNCIIPLDMIFVKNNKITKIHHSCEPCNSNNCKNYCGNGTMVLEVKGGTCKKLNIVEGHSFNFS